MPAASPILRARGLQWVLVSLLPRRRAWPVRDWPGGLEKARAVEADTVERLLAIASLLLVTWLLRPPTGLEVPQPLLFLAQMALAAPALLALTGPFNLRRLRRGLQAAYRQDHPPAAPPGSDAP